MVSSVTVTSCSTTDLACLCTNSAYINKAIHCINSSCDATDASNSYAYATFACKNAGVTVPSVDSVLNPGGSSSSAAAPPPATTAAAADPPATSATNAASSPPYPISSSTVKVATPSSSGNRTYTSAVVTFQGAAPKAVGVEKGIVGAVALGVVAVLAAGML
jgi:CFEM domain